MPDLVALRAMFGQDEVNHGTARYRVAVGRSVHVPREVASHLVKNGGFAVESKTEVGEADREARLSCSPSLVRVHHPCSGTCSYRGCTYNADQKGDVLVPADAVAALMGHGFVAVPSAQRVNGPYSVDVASTKHGTLGNFPSEAPGVNIDNRGGRPNGIR